MSSARNPVVKRGKVHVLFAYDVGLSVDLARSKQRITDLTAVAEIKHRGHAPRYFQFDPPPLRVTQKVNSIVIDAHATKGAVELLVYDFGGVSVAYEIPFEGPLEDLVRLSCELASSTVLREDSLERVQALLAVIEPAVNKVAIATLTEDYTIFLIEEFQRDVDPNELVAQNAGTIARVLRSEKDELSEQETQEAVSNRVSFGTRDVAVIDWNAALLYDRESEDTRAVLEFANLQLLELRFLDEELDRALDRSYELIGKRGGFASLRFPGETRKELGRVARLQVDSAILFERVNNALKLLGDQYLARVYRAASQRYRLHEWNTTLLRKLETIENIYDKVHDQSSGFRMELLEWIIVVLIAVELVLPFVVGKHG